MRFQESLQVQLRTRYRRLYKSDHGSYASEVRYLRAWLEGQPALKAAVRAIERSEPSLDPDAWLEALERRGGVEYPDSETGRAKVVWRILVRIAEGKLQPHQVAWQFSGERNANDAVREFTDGAVEAFVEYLEQRLEAESDMLYVLERYRRRVLWFEQQRLWSGYQQDTARGEALYDDDLRQFLFEQGVDYPYSQPVSPSGRVDIMAEADADDPLTCEVKLFNGESYGAAYLAKGVSQARRYAEDYGKTDAYLVVFNLAERPIDLPTDDTSKDWPPRLHVGDVTVFLVVVQARPLASASQSGRVEPIGISRDQLVGGA